MDFTERLIPKPDNLKEIRQLLSRRRPSLDANRFTEVDFDMFHMRMIEGMSKGDVTQKLIPLLEGNSHTVIANSRGNLFTNMRSMTDGLTPMPLPDFWDGVPATAVETPVKDALGNYIIPTESGDRVPIVPNFFLEVKRAGSSVAVVDRQALNDGVYGARASEHPLDI